MSKHYTEDEWAAGVEAIADFFGPDGNFDRFAARAVLDAVAPAIAARALRDAANEAWGRTATSPRTIAWLNHRADEIEAGS